MLVPFSLSSHHKTAAPVETDCDSIGIMNENRNGRVFFPRPKKVENGCDRLFSVTAILVWICNE